MTRPCWRYVITWVLLTTGLSGGSHADDMQQAVELMNVTLSCEFPVEGGECSSSYYCDSAWTTRTQQYAGDAKTFTLRELVIERIMRHGKLIVDSADTRWVASYGSFDVVKGPSGAELTLSCRNKSMCIEQSGKSEDPNGPSSRNSYQSMVVSFCGDSQMRDASMEGFRILSTSPMPKPSSSFELLQLGSHSTFHFVNSMGIRKYQ
jgi:hypothetical protein